MKASKKNVNNFVFLQIQTQKYFFSWIHCNSPCRTFDSIYFIQSCASPSAIFAFYHTHTHAPLPIAYTIDAWILGLKIYGTAQSFIFLLSILWLVTIKKNRHRENHFQYTRMLFYIKSYNRHFNVNDLWFVNEEIILTKIRFHRFVGNFKAKCFKEIPFQRKFSVNMIAKNKIENICLFGLYKNAL